MKLIILDRDGVINHDSDDYIRSPDEWLPIQGSLAAIARLNQFGYHVVIVTNQSGIGRGLFNMITLNAIHQKMHSAAHQVGARMDAVFFCPHTEHDDCECRKPKTGLFHAVAQRFDITLGHHIAAVGDSLRDLQAASAAGCQPYLVLTGKGQHTLQHGGLPLHTLIYPDLAGVVDFLVQSG